MYVCVPDLHIYFNQLFTTVVIRSKNQRLVPMLSEFVSTTIRLNLSLDLHVEYSLKSDSVVEIPLSLSQWESQ